MLPPTRRLNYFDHQFLRVDDFTDEQAYHLGMRRAHNRLLHAPGVAMGLAVAHAGSALTVSPGVALDGEGREIVLTEPVELVAPPDAQRAWVTIAYDERRVEPTAETGAAGDRRWEETPVVRVDPAPPADPEARLVLARVTLAGGRVTGVDDGDAPAHRRVAGPAPGAELEVRSLAVQGSAAVGGALGVARTLSVGETLSVGGAAGGATLSLPGGRAEGDLRVGTGSSGLRVGVEVTGAAAGTARLGAEGTAPRLVLGAAGTDVLTVRPGRVGVGTDDPEVPLHVIGTRLRLENAGGDKHLDLRTDGLELDVHATGGELFVHTGTSGEALHLNPFGGNVGVGTGGGPPTARLHVAGGNGDLGATEGDFKVGSDTHRLKVGVSTGSIGAGDVRMRAVGGTQKLMLGGGANDVLTVTETAVGVGTTVPGYRLHVLGTDRAVGTFESRMAETLLTLTTSEGVEKRVEFCNRSGGIAAIWAGGAVDALQAHRDGNIHIPRALAVGRAAAAGSTARLQVAGGSGDLGATEGDFAIGNDAHRLKVGVTTTGTDAGNVRVRAVGGTGRLMLGAGTRDMISVTGDAIGFGTTAPTHPYHFVGGPNIALFESTGVDTFIRLISKEGMDNRVEFCNRPGGRAAIWVEGAGDALYIERGGNAFIPGKLTVKDLAVTGRVSDQRVRVEKLGNTPVSIETTDNVARFYPIPDMEMQFVSTGGTFLLRFHIGGVQIMGVDFGRAEFRLMVDGVQNAYHAAEFNSSLGWELRVVSLERMLTLAAGTHTISVEWSVIRAVGNPAAKPRATLLGSFYSDHRTLMAIEL